MKFRLIACASALALAAGVVPGAVAQEGEATPAHIAAYSYGYDAPQEFTEGSYSFTFENTSDKHVHEFVLLKHKTDKSTQKVLEIAERNEKKAQKMVKFVGANFAKPGKQGKEKYNFTADFKEGQRYFYLCFVQNSKKAKPHYKKGMLAEFTVQPAAPQ